MFIDVHCAVNTRLVIFPDPFIMRAVFVPRLIPFGLVMGGPPCSLFIGACASVHCRRPWRLLGDESNRKIRLANLIWENVASGLQGGEASLVMFGL